MTHTKCVRIYEYTNEEEQSKHTKRNIVKAKQSDVSMTVSNEIGRIKFKSSAAIACYAE